MCFPGFLAGDTVFADEIRFTLGCLTFLNICTNRGPTPEQLVGQGTRNTWFSIKETTQPNDPTGEFKSPGGQITLQISKYPLFPFKLQTSSSTAAYL